MGIFVEELMKKLRSDVTEEILFESSGLKNLMEKDVKEMSDIEIARAIEELNSRLEYGSNYGEGVKFKEEFENRLESLKVEKSRRAEEGKVPNPKDATSKQIEDLKEDDEEVQVGDDEMPPKEEEEEAAPEDISAPEPEVEQTPEPAVTADEGMPSEETDLVANMAAAKDHFEKGNLKVAKELVKLIKDNIKDFEDKIKAKLDSEKAAAAPEAQPTEESKEIKEQDYTVIAKGISDEDVAKRIADDKGGVVTTDENDDKKFMVIVKEKFSAKEVSKLLAGLKEELEEAKKANEEEVKENKEKDIIELKTLKENFEELVNVLAQVSDKKKETLKEAVEELDEKKKEVIEAIGNLAILKKMKINEMQGELLKDLLEKSKSEQEG